MSKPPGIIYKYIGPDRIDVLSSKLIRFTQPSALNDPFELNFYFEEVFDHEEITEDLKFINTHSLINAAIEDEISKLETNTASHEEISIFKELVSNSMQQHLKNLGDENLKRLLLRKANMHTEFIRKEFNDAFHSKIGILSLTEDPLSPPMWGNYAQSSKGIAIGFDSSHKYFHQNQSTTDELRHLRKVIYEDREAAKTLRSVSKDIFILKKKAWSYECEWRMLLPLSYSEKEIATEEGDKVYLFRYPPEAIKEIIFGLNASQRTVANCLESIKSFEISPEIKKVVKLGQDLALELYKDIS